jgi:hypothetical protein
MNEVLQRLLLVIAAISQHDSFPEHHTNINNKIGYEVSAFRAIEWVMYMSRT